MRRNFTEQKSFLSLDITDFELKTNTWFFAFSDQYILLEETQSGLAASGGTIEVTADGQMLHFSKGGKVTITPNTKADVTSTSSDPQEVTPQTKDHHGVTIETIHVLEEAS